MITQELIERAIESAKCRIYRVKANQGQSIAHQRKADEQAILQMVTIEALKTMLDLKKRNMKLEDIENYMIFEDECIKKNFTFKSLLEARERSTPKAPTDKQGTPLWGYCPNCGEAVPKYANPKFCKECGQALKWE